MVLIIKLHQILIQSDKQIFYTYLYNDNFMLIYLKLFYSNYYPKYLMLEYLNNYHYFIKDNLMLLYHQIIFTSNNFYTNILLIYYNHFLQHLFHFNFQYDFKDKYILQYKNTYTQLYYTNSHKYLISNKDFNCNLLLTLMLQWIIIKNHFNHFFTTIKIQNLTLMNNLYDKLQYLIHIIYQIHDFIQHFKINVIHL